MRIHTLLFALFVLGARAATIADKTEVQFEKKLEEVIKEVLSNKDIVPETLPCEKELIDQATVVKDVDNNLRKNVQVVDIPVKVVVEEVKPSLKSDNEKESNNEVVPETDNIKRVPIDLKNPGPPQRQEHETQNPEHFDDNKQSWASFIRQNVIETQNVFNNGVQNFQENLQNWWTNNQQYIQIQQNLQELQTNFQTQINKLNETVQNYIPAGGSSPANPETQVSQTKSTVESGLKMLESNLKAGVKSLADGVQALASAKEESETATTAPGGIPPFGQGPFASYFQQLQQQIQSGFQNMTTTLQSYLNQTQNGDANNSSGPTNIFQNWSQGVTNLINQQGSNQPSAAQADESVPAKPPTIWQNIQSIFNPLGGQQNQGQQQQDTPAAPPATPNRPIVQAIQNSPIYQTVASVFQPNKPATTANKPQQQKPEEQKPEEQKPEPENDEVIEEGSNVVPVESKPEPDQQKQKPQVVQHTQSGPIKQMLIEKNPIAQGIVGAVQRIQQSITKPEKPRDAVKDGEKGLLLLGHKPGFKPGHDHGGHHPGGHHPGGGAVAGSSVDDSGRVTIDKLRDAAEDKPKEPAHREPETAEVVKGEEKPSEVPDKTE